MVYIMNLRMNFGMPSTHYYRTVHQGYLDCKLDTSVLNKALGDSAMKFYSSAVGLPSMQMRMNFQKNEPTDDIDEDEEPIDDEDEDYDDDWFEVECPTCEEPLIIDDEALAKEEKLAVVLGSEGDGLAQSTIANCDYTVKIPMYHGVDSLNVAAASAVAFWELRSR